MTSETSNTNVKCFYLLKISIKKRCIKVTGLIDTALLNKCFWVQRLEIKFRYGHAACKALRVLSKGLTRSLSPNISLNAKQPKRGPTVACLMLQMFAPQCQLSPSEEWKWQKFISLITTSKCHKTPTDKPTPDQVGKAQVQRVFRAGEIILTPMKGMNFWHESSSGLWRVQETKRE